MRIILFTTSLLIRRFALVYSWENTPAQTNPLGELYKYYKNQ
jgi:hypothetical protein